MGASRTQNDQGYRELKDAVDENRGRNAAEVGLAALVGRARHQPEQQQRPDRSQPFVPLPLVEEKHMSGPHRFQPGRGRFAEDPSEGNGCGRRLGSFPPPKRTKPRPQRIAENHRQHATETDAHSPHQRVQQECHRKQRHGLPAFAGHNSRNRKQDQRRCQIARVQMLIHQVEPRPRDRERQHGRNHGDSGPPRRGLFKELSHNAPAGPDHQEETDQLPKQFRPGHRHSSCQNKTRHPHGKNQRPGQRRRCAAALSARSTRPQEIGSVIEPHGPRT